MLLLLMPCGLFAQTFDLQGHRGARGLFPENTVPAFLEALRQGVTTLELDVVVTKDRKVVVSHEPWFNGLICTAPDGSAIAAEGQEKTHNIYKMPYSKVKKYDCGTKHHPGFPEQQNLPAAKPLLTEVIAAAEAYCKKNNLPPPFYNIELKSMPEGDGEFHPAPAAFSKLVYRLLAKNLPFARVTIQSFDFRILKEFHQNYPEVGLASLVYSDKEDLDAMLESLGFVPKIYSPHFKMLSEASVKAAQAKGMKVIPWTVNERSDMEKLKAWGVDGLITDYPDRAKGL